MNARPDAWQCPNCRWHSNEPAGPLRDREIEVHQTMLCRVTLQAGTATRYGRTPNFSGDLAWASNLYTGAPYLSRHFGIEVATSEHDFNARKPIEREAVEWILAAPTPAEAKNRGNSRTAFTLRPDWDHGGRVRAMQDALSGKFTDPAMRRRLIDTGTEPLIETGYWHDLFWGGECFCPRHAGQRGVNMLGELLMALRTRYIEQQQGG
jgi:predicted NAD-dependent protein-ADP-ribosyltransferase YbiA (DUF1768 family)